MSLPPVEIVEVAPEVALGGERLALIAGPCVIESYDVAAAIAEFTRELAAHLGMPYVFKASFDKANRTSVTSFRGPGLDEGLKILARIKAQLGVPVLTDIHETGQVAPVAEVADILQIPAFLSRQTDLLVAAGGSGRVVNVKKGQFLSPNDMQNSLGKVLSTGSRRVCLTERGASFGYNNLVVDMRGLPIMRSFGFPVIFDGTHSVQLPGGAGGASSGQREYVDCLVRAAVAAGVDGLFLEVHPDPDHALCDGPNMVPLSELRSLLETARRIHEVVR
jgi:2-dehydro-3-deoxyphosphooctonate aldolase (KDO 8-P synthase)